MAELSVSRLLVSHGADKHIKQIVVPHSELRQALGLGGDWIFVRAEESPDPVIEDHEDLDGAVRFEFRLAE